MVTFRTPKQRGVSPLVAGKEPQRSLWFPVAQNVRLKVLVPAFTSPLFPVGPEEDGALLSDSSDLAESTSVVRAPHTSAMLTRGRERTLRSLGLSRAAATHPARPTPRGNVTEHAGLLPRAATLGGASSHGRLPVCRLALSPGVVTLAGNRKK